MFYSRFSLLSTLDKTRRFSFFSPEKKSMRWIDPQAGGILLFLVVLFTYAIFNSSAFLFEGTCRSGLVMPVLLLLYSEFFLDLIRP